MGLSIYTPVYTALIWLLSPFLYLWLWLRCWRGKEERTRLSERWGKTIRQRPMGPGPLIWIHAASVGESQAALPLINRLLEDDPKTHILLTSGTVTSAQLMEQRLPYGAIHQYAPLDHPLAVRRFLQRWRPDMGIWIESELWPNLIHAAARRNIPLALINARLSDRSFRRWQKLPRFIRTLLNAFQIILTQSDADTTKFTTLGAQNVKTVGNIKFAAPPLAVEEAAAERLQHQIGKRPVWLAASTHPGEEEQVLQAHLQISQDCPKLLTLLVPRHPHRGAEIKNLVEQHGLQAQLRSQQSDLLPATHVYIADTLGEMGLFFRLSDIVFMGGSLTPIGGHNLLEAAQLNSAILYGPHMHLQGEILKAFKAGQAGIEVEDAPQLAQQVSQLLTNPGKKQNLQTAAQQVSAANTSLLEVVSQDIKAILALSGAGDRV